MSVAGKCSVCGHGQRESIERALVAGEPIRQIAAKYGLGKTAVGDHRVRHLPESLHAAAVRSGEAREDGLLEELDQLRREARKILAEARRSKDHGSALGALAMLTRQIELFAKYRPPPPPPGPSRFRLVFNTQGADTIALEPGEAPALPAAIDVESVGPGPLETAAEKAMRATAQAEPSGPEPVAAVPRHQASDQPRDYGGPRRACHPWCAEEDQAEADARSGIVSRASLRDF
jgi:hypothetical protein